MTEYCSKCGSALEMRECKGEDSLIPYCPECKEFRFPTFSVAIITAVLNPQKTRVLLMRQYGRERYNFLAGYINKGEDAETALKREMQEEMQLKPVSFRYIRSSYFAKNNVMMMCYLSIADSDDISHYSRWEVDEARWCTYNEATNIVIQGGVAAYLLEEIKNEIND